MFLALGLKPGGKFYVGDTEVVVLGFDNFSSAVLETKGKRFKVSDQMTMEILPKVFVSCGKPADGHLARYKHLLARAEREKEARKRALEDGKLTLEEYKELPPLEMPKAYYPRLLIEAPREIVILREELYKRGRRRT